MIQIETQREIALYMFMLKMHVLKNRKNTENTRIMIQIKT